MLRAMTDEETEMKHRITLPGTCSVPIRRHDGGYVAEGPGFYIWDEDPGEVLRVARELGRGNRRPKPSARLLIVPPGGEAEPDPGPAGEAA